MPIPGSPWWRERHGSIQVLPRAPCAGQIGLKATWTPPTQGMKSGGLERGQHGAQPSDRFGIGYDLDALDRVAAGLLDSP
jgi:hypothetical protein